MALHTAQRPGNLIRQRCLVPLIEECDVVLPLVERRLEHEIVERAVFVVELVGVGLKVAVGVADRAGPG